MQEIILVKLCKAINLLDIFEDFTAGSLIEKVEMKFILVRFKEKKKIVTVHK